MEQQVYLYLAFRFTQKAFRIIRAWNNTALSPGRTTDVALVKLLGLHNIPFLFHSEKMFVSDLFVKQTLYPWDGVKLSDDTEPDIPYGREWNILCKFWEGSANTSLGWKIKGLFDSMGFAQSFCLKLWLRTLRSYATNCAAFMLDAHLIQHQQIQISG